MGERGDGKVWGRGQRDIINIGCYSATGPLL